MDIFTCIDNLLRLGGRWKATRINERFLSDAIECTMLVGVPEGVYRAAVVTRQQTNLSKVRAEVKFYSGASLERIEERGPNKGKVKKFKHGDHPPSQTSKVCEFEEEVLYNFSSFLGIKRWKPSRPLSAAHQALVKLTNCEIAKVEAEQAGNQRVVETTKVAAQQDLKEVALRALSK